MDPWANDDPWTTPPTIPTTTTTSTTPIPTTSTTVEITTEATTIVTAATQWLYKTFDSIVSSTTSSTTNNPTTSLGADDNSVWNYPNNNHHYNVDNSPSLSGWSLFVSINRVLF